MMRHSKAAENRKKGSIVKRFAMLFLLAAMSVFVACEGNLLEGASDDDSYEARIEEALIALDDENYSKAKKLLEGLRGDYPNNTEVCEYLSNAYAGLAGLDTYTLLRTIDELEQESDAGNIAMVGLILGDENGLMTPEDVSTKLAYIETAISTYNLCIPNPTDDQIVQLGLESLVDAALRIGDVVLEDVGADSITLTEDGLRAVYENRVAVFEGIEGIGETLDYLTDDMERIRDAVEVLGDVAGEDNDMEESFFEFEQALDPDGDGVDIEDLQDYINRLNSESE